MDLHANAKLGPAGRLALCRLIESGVSQRRAAVCFSVSPATANRWWQRFRLATVDERSGLGWARDRSSRPRRSPRRLTAAAEAPILRARRETNLGPARLAGLLRRARSTIWKVLWRNGVSRRPRGQRQTFRRYEWSRAGALLHLDVKQLARFEVAGHHATGHRFDKDRNRGVGYDFLHCVVDDHTRLAYVELHPWEDQETNARTLERAIAWFAELGLDPPEAVMTDNHMIYRRSRRFADVIADAGAKHIRTPSYTPRWNGKVERFIQTLQNEWAYAHRWENSHDRARALPSFIRYYNRRRPHSSLSDRPPISRVHILRGQDT
jgi:transposase InsO family protein